MVTDKSSPDPIQPLSVGNVVSAGLKLYRSRFKDYLRIALQASAWLFLPLLGLTAIAVAIGFLAIDRPALWAIVVLLGLAAIPVYIFCSAKFIVQQTIIARLAFGDLTNQPETVTAARQRLTPQMWPLWAAAIIVSLILFGVSFGFSLVIGVGSSLLLIVAGDSARFAAVVSVLINLLQLVSLAVQFWLSARFQIFSLPIALEEGIGPIKSVERSWQLSRGNGGRIVLILLIAFLISMPLYVLLAGVLIVGAIPFFTVSTGPANPTTVVLLLLLGILILVLLIACFILFLPLWETIRSAIYYDLRSRREGMGLELRDRPPLV